MTKEAERRWKTICNHYKWYSRKYGDVRYCQVCHSALPKSENAPDFYIAQVGTWVEAKNSNASGTWNCCEIYEGGVRKNQRNFLNQNGGWLFIELTDGKTVKNKAAYLVPWDSWIKVIEPTLIENGMKSIRRKTTFNKDKSIRRYGADILLSEYELTWETNIGWIIPPGHKYWQFLKEQLLNELKKIDEEYTCDKG